MTLKLLSLFPSRPRVEGEEKSLQFFTFLGNFFAERLAGSEWKFRTRRMAMQSRLEHFGCEKLDVVVIRADLIFEEL